MGKVSRTKFAQPSVLNALGWRGSVTNLTNGSTYWALFGQAHPIKGRQAEGAEFEVLDFLAHRLEDL